MRRMLAAVLMLGVGIFFASAAPIVLTNHGFEEGDLTGWASTGNVTVSGPTSVVTFDGTVWDISPAGNFMAAMNSNGATAASLDGFFGLPAGTLQSLNTTGTLTNGSAIYQDFFGNAGDTVTMYWDYVARDYVPFNDPAFAVVTSPTGTFVQTLASIYSGGLEVGTSGHSTWQEFSFTLTDTGTHRIGFAVTNDRDTILDSALFLDSEPGGSSAVPGLTPSFPVLPDSNPLPGIFVFINPAPGLWYDPPFAEAYTYQLSGDALFTEFATPPTAYGFGDLTFQDLLGPTTFTASPGQVYDISGLGTTNFMISGIPFGLIDFQSPDFPIAFPAFLNWSGTATELQITITPHPEEVIPEPSTYALMVAGLGVLAWFHRRKARPSPDRG